MDLARMYGNRDPRARAAELAHFVSQMLPAEIAWQHGERLRNRRVGRLYGERCRSRARYRLTIDDTVRAD